MLEKRERGRRGIENKQKKRVPGLVGIQDGMQAPSDRCFVGTTMSNESAAVVGAV